MGKEGVTTVSETAQQADTIRKATIAKHLLANSISLNQRTIEQNGLHYIHEKTATVKIPAVALSAVTLIYTKKLIFRSSVNTKYLT